MGNVRCVAYFSKVIHFHICTQLFLYKLSVMKCLLSCEYDFQVYAEATDYYEGTQFEASDLPQLDARPPVELVDNGSQCDIIIKCRRRSEGNVIELHVLPTPYPITQPNISICCYGIMMWETVFMYSLFLNKLGRVIHFHMCSTVIYSVS